MWIEAVQEPVGVRLDAPVAVVVRKQREKSVTWVAGGFNDFPGLPFTPPDIDVLDVRELGPVMKVSVAEVMLPTLITWGRPVRKSRIHLQREVFSHRVQSLETMVLNTEL